MSRPRAIRVPSFAKINLGLEVLGVREDGYHELRTLFQTIDLADEITLRPQPRVITVRCDHPGVPEDGTNLAARAAEALRRHAGISDGVEITIEKRIPVAGGLGGGSSNAAAVLMALDRMWRLGLGAGGLQPIARRLGADVPFFLVGGTALGLARGDEIYPLHAQLRAHVVLVAPDIAVPTPAVFKQLDASLTAREDGTSIFRFLSGQLEGAPAYGNLRNELEPAALETFPELRRQVDCIRSILKPGGALMTSLSGSGASYFALFDEPRRARKAQDALVEGGFRVYRCRTLTLDQYRRSWAAGRGRVRGIRPGKERTSWRSPTSRSSRSTTRS